MNAIYTLPELGVSILKKEYYDPVLGVQFKRGEMELLNL